MQTNIIGSKIAEARKKINISQAQLAQRLFISPQAVGKWERGESIPDIITFNRLAEIVGVDLNYFSENFPSTRDKNVAGMSTGGTGGIEQPVQDDASTLAGQELLTNFSGSNLVESDFAGVIAHKRRFYGSAMRASNFAGADLSGSVFTGSDVREANFDETNLTDCSFSASDITGSSLNKTIFVRTQFSASSLDGANFKNATLIDVKLTKTDLRKTIFENCVFNGADFMHSDLRGLCLDGQIFIGVKFHNVALKETTFKGATLQNVSFRAINSLTNKYYRELKTICFDGAVMDKLTYAALKSFGAGLSKVTVK